MHESDCGAWGRGGVHSLAAQRAGLLPAFVFMCHGGLSLARRTRRSFGCDGADGSDGHTLKVATVRDTSQTETRLKRCETLALSLRLHHTLVAFFE